MATGLYMLRDGSVMVACGPRHIPISHSQYKANGYKPPLEKLVTELPHADTARPHSGTSRQGHRLGQAQTPTYRRRLERTL